MAGRRRGWIAGALLLVACGGPLDRRDGALVIRLAGLPDSVSTLEVSVVAGGRRFDARIPRPQGDIISDFSAIPEGLAMVDVRALARVDVVIEFRREVQIVAGQTTDLLLEPISEARPLGAPTIVIEEPPEGAPHRLFDGPLSIRVRSLDASISTTLRLLVNETPVVPAGGRDLWVATIDAREHVAAVPGVLRVEVEGCVQSAPETCTRLVREVEVNRELWTVDLGGPSIGGPTYSAEHAAVLIGDERGHVHALGVEDGQPLMAPLDVGAPVRTRLAVVGQRAVVAATDGVVRAIDLATFLESAGSVDLAAGSPTSPVADADQVVLGHGRRFLRFDPLSGVVSTIADLPNAIAAPPFADDSGAIVADQGGHIRAFGRLSFEVDLDAAVIAAPVRVDQDTFVATLDAELVRIDADGRVQSRTGLLGPSAHAPVRLGAAVVAASADEVAFVTDGRVASVRLGAPITGAPRAWPDGQRVVVGLANGRVVVVARDGVTRDLTRLRSAALTPRLLSDPVRLLIADSQGDLSMLRPEEDF